MAPAKQKNGAVSAGGSSHGGGLAITEPQRGLCGAEDDLWVLEGQQAAIMLPWHLFKLPPSPPHFSGCFHFFLDGRDWSLRLMCRDINWRQ